MKRLTKKEKLLMMGKHYPNLLDLKKSKRFRNLDRVDFSDNEIKQEYKKLLGTKLRKVKSGKFSDTFEFKNKKGEIKRIKFNKYGIKTKK